MSTARIASAVAGRKRKTPSPVDAQVSLAALLRRADVSVAAARVQLDERALAARQAARGDFLYVWTHPGTATIDALAVRADSDAAALVHALLDHLHRENVMGLHLRPDEARATRVRLFRMAYCAALDEDERGQAASTGPRQAPPPAAPSAQALLDATRGADDADDSADDAAHAVFVARWLAPVRGAFRRVALPAFGAAGAAPAYRVRVVQ